MLKQAKIKPLIAQRLPLEKARCAHEMTGEGGVLGKIVLLPNGSGTVWLRPFFITAGRA